MSKIPTSNVWLTMSTVRCRIETCPRFGQPFTVAFWYEDGCKRTNLEVDVTGGHRCPVCGGEKLMEVLR